MENSADVKQATGIVKAIQRNSENGLVSLIIQRKDSEVKTDLPIKVNTDFDLIPLESALLNEKVAYWWTHCEGYFDNDPKFYGSYPEEEKCRLTVLSGKLKNREYEISWREEDYKNKNLTLQLNQ